MKLFLKRLSASHDRHSAAFSRRPEQTAKESLLIGHNVTELVLEAINDLRPVSYHKIRSLRLPLEDQTARFDLQDGRSVNFIEGCKKKTLWCLLNLLQFELKMRIEFAIGSLSFLMCWAACNCLL